MRFVNSVLEPPIRSLFTADELQELNVLAKNSSNKDRLVIPGDIYFLLCFFYKFLCIALMFNFFDSNELLLSEVNKGILKFLD